MSIKRFKSSFKGTPVAPTIKEDPNSTEPPEPPQEHMQDPRRKPLAELDLQLISDDARSQFADILGRVDGKKDIVIQQELMSLLDHVTPIGILKK